MSHLNISLLGSFQASLGEEPLVAFESDKARALLAYLAVEADRPHRRDSLAGLLWSDTPEQKARRSLRGALANLRQLLHDQEAQPPYFDITRQTIQFNKHGDYKLDVNDFLAGIAESSESQDLAVNRTAAIKAFDLASAVALYRGQFLAGFYLRDAPLFEEWALITRESLQRRALWAMNQLTNCYLDNKDYEQAIWLAGRQVELEPFQEAAHQQLMWALALNGQRNEALLHYEQFERLLAEELGVTPLDQTKEMVDLLRDGQFSAAPATDLVLRRPPHPVGPCPYRGLSAFRESDAPFFYGREAFTGRLAVSITTGARVAAIVGSSGCGKSSVIFAGLLPKIRAQGEWLICTLRPGNQPFHRLSAVLSPHLEATDINNNGHLAPQKLLDALQEDAMSLSDAAQQVLADNPEAQRLLLVIDQFEELYTLCMDEGLRLQFLKMLTDAAEEGRQGMIAPLALVLALRADFMGQALSYRPFADILNDSAIILGPMNREELRTVIENPTVQQGAAFEPGLVTRILDDVGEEPGNLPLLEFALTELWDRLDQGWLTHAAYEEIGKTGGALAGYAENVYLTLDENKQADMQRVLVQLVQPGRRTEDARRLALRHEFSPESWGIVQYLADKRLVVTGQDEIDSESAELVHEALIHNWDRLSSWVNADRSFRLWQEQLRAARRQWEASNYDDGALLRGAPLATAENWLKERPGDLGELERRYIEASLKKRQDRRMSELARQEKEQSLERRSRSLLRVLVMVLALATVISTAMALFARNEARGAIEASSLGLAATARQAMGEKDSTSALVMAMAANRIAQPPLESQRALLEAAYAPGPRKLYSVSELFGDMGGYPTTIALMPDGQSAFTGMSDGQIIQWETAAGKEIQRFYPEQGAESEQDQGNTSSGVNDLAICPDGSLLVAATGDGDVFLWDVNNGRELRRFDGHSGAVHALAITPDGQFLFSGGQSGFSPRDPGELFLWNLSSGEEVRRFVGLTEMVTNIALSPDGRTLVVSAGEVDYTTTPGQVYELAAWDVESGELIHQSAIERHVTDLAISPRCEDPTGLEEEPCDHLALSASADHNLYLWKVATGEDIQTLEGHAEVITAVAFSPDGRRALSGDDEGILLLWNLQNGEIIARFDLHTAGITDLAISPDGRSALATTGDDQIILLDLYNAAELGRFQGHEGAVTDVLFSPGSQQAISASGSPDPAAPIIEEDAIRLWNLNSGEQVGRLNWQLNDVFQIDISPDGRRLLSGHMYDNTVRLWDVATGQEIRRFEGHFAPVLSVAFSPDGRYGLSGAIDSLVNIWDLESGEVVRQLSGDKEGIWALAVSQDGRTALSGADERLVFLWDLETGEKIQQFAGHTETITGIAFSPDGRRAISGDSEGYIIEWDLQTGQQIQRIAAHGGSGTIGRTRVAYVPKSENGSGGKYALSSGWDGTLALWDLETGEEIHRFSGHDSDFIFDIAISEDGKTALSGGTDSTIIQWQLDMPPLEELQAWITTNRYVRDLSCEERSTYQIEPLCEPDGDQS
ncbi:MAG: BTAD domain-containing putative transcriptional regulator [Candidatus Promineifilaceae bacterium]